MLVGREARVLDAHLVSSYRQLRGAERAALVGLKRAKLIRLGRAQPDFRARNRSAGRVCDPAFKGRAHLGGLREARDSQGNGHQAREGPAQARSIRHQLPPENFHVAALQNTKLSHYPFVRPPEAAARAPSEVES